MQADLKGMMYYSYSDEGTMSDEDEDRDGDGDERWVPWQGKEEDEHDKGRKMSMDQSHLAGRAQLKNLEASDHGRMDQ